MVARLGPICAVVVGGLIAASCAIPTQQDPNIISSGHVPPGLISPTLPSTTTTQPPHSSEVPVKIYLLGPNLQLQALQRVVLVPAPLTSIITSLLAGPDSTEVAQGISTAIPNNVTVLSAVTQAGVVLVNFNLAFGGITGTATELAVAQVVATVAAQAGPSTGVIFEIEGQRISVPIASGAQVSGPVTLSQFAANGAG